MKQLLSFIAIIILRSYCFVSGQIIYSEMRLFNVSDGLSQSHITALMQDSKGFIWLGTEDGLNRYDGYEFVIYSHQPYDINSLSNNYINAICEDKNGILWIATNKGLNSYDVKNNLFTSYFYDPKQSNTISDNVVLNVYLDSKKTLWVKTLKSLDQFDSKTKTFRRFPHYLDPFRYTYGNIPYPIYEDKQERLWIGTKDGLNFFDRDLQLFNRYISLEYNSKSLSHDEIRSIFEDTDGTLWIGTTNGLNSFNPTLKEFKRYYVEHNSSARTNRINALYEDKTGLFLIGTMGGLYVFDKHAGKFEKLVISHKDIARINSIYSIIRDNSGLIWVGTQKGLIKINVQKSKFKLYRSDENTSYTFASNDIGSLYSPNPDVLLIGNWEKGLNIFNRKTNIVQTFDFSETGVEEYNHVHYIFELYKDKYLLGTNNGILVLNSKSGEHYNFCDEKSIKDCELLLQKRVNSIIRDEVGRIWIGTIYGLYRYDLTKQQIKAYLNNPENNNSLCNNTIYSLISDYKGNIWIGTNDGLDCFNCGTEIFTHYNASPKSKPSLSSSTIYSLQLDQMGILWVGTASGLNKFNTRDKSIKIFTEKDGLSDGLIYAILFDNSRNVWVSTNHGINMIDPNTNRIRVFDIYDGLQDFEFNLNATFRSKNGELFFGGVAGINAFFPDSLKRNNYIPQVRITSIEMIPADGKSIPLNPFADKLTIPYRTYCLSVNFASLDYTNPGKNNFAYKFYSDKESNWINIGNKHWVTFSNLKPGEYRFKVKGSNNDLVWNELGTSITVFIDSPFWLKPEAYYLYVFIFIISILVIYRYRTYHLLKSNRMLKEREITTHQVEQQKEQLSVKNRNITDSINYAKRIQEALMPSEKSFKKILPESFVFHQPKDIVSGDFFWVSERGNKIYVAAVDCTGHGVPGAFMSIIGFELFRNITHSRGVDDPSQILNILNHEFEEIFRDVENFTFKDGMDIAFCVIDKQSRILEFSGAVNPIYLIRDNKITEIRGSRFSVGLDDNCEEEQTFENKQIILQKDDMFYLFSDGYADQFGGDEDKKFKYRRFRHLLLTIHQYTMEEQKRLLEERINRWKGNLEQVDDILVIGFRPVFNNT